MLDIITIEYLADKNIDIKVDKALRDLLSRNFHPQKEGNFTSKRFYKDPYPHRFVAKDQHENLIAHIGIHEKWLRAQQCKYSIAGIGDVCVDLKWRRQGLLNSLFAAFTQHVLVEQFDFGLLFGEARIYSSQGYQSTYNLMVKGDDEKWQLEPAMHSVLSGKPWPVNSVYLEGNRF